MGIIFGLLAALGQAFGYVSIKKSFKELNPSIAFFFDACFGLLLWVPFALFTGINFSQLPVVVGFALISALLSEAFVFYALSKGYLSISGTLFASYPIFTIFFSYILNGERLLPLHWLFVGLTILGVIIVSLPKRFKKEELKEKLYVVWPLAAAITVGLSDTLSKGIIDKTSAETFLFALAFAQLPVAIGYLLISRQSLGQFELALREFSKYKFAILGSFLNIVAVLFLWLAFSSTFASIASPLTAAYPALLVILSMIFLKEKPSKKELIGLITAIIGIVGISMYY
ncbi:MAG: DMT family transporter [Candidatus Woesebacteria bacterium]|nr:MAG: DMT family transporter [Candidatus Woesebacteria bacterium]